VGTSVKKRDCSTTQHKMWHQHMSICWCHMVKAAPPTTQLVENKQIDKILYFFDTYAVIVFKIKSPLDALETLSNKD